MVKAKPITPAGATPEVEALFTVDAKLKGPPRTLWRDAWHRFRRHKLALVGTGILLFFFVAALAGPSVWTVGREEIDFTSSMAKSSLQHPMGTDDLGRDILARALFGGRISLAVGVVAMLISITFGTAIGALAGFFGGIADHILMRITDLFLALPQLPLLLLMIFLFRDRLRAALGPEAGVFILIVVVIGTLNWMPTARIVRATFLSIKEKEFVEAARALGVPRRHIMFKHILPNALSPIIVAATLSVGAAIITESVLSFLGLGFPPDTPTWGRLLYDGQNFLELAPHMVIWPGLLIFLTVLSINYIGDGLRDALDPRSRR